jgi:glycosyltransferase involved in cell wall biosynthesis
MGSGISICIPVYNPDKKLTSLLQNLIQTGLIHEVVIIETIDKSSNDQLRADLHEIRKTTGVPIVHEFIKKIDFNHSKVRNSLISIAQNDVLIFCTQDIEIDSSFNLKSLVHEFENFDALSIAHTSDVQSFSYIFKQMFNRISKSHYSDSAEVVWWSNNFCIYRQSILKLLPFPNISYAEDLYWAKSAVTQGFKLKVSDSQTIKHLNQDTIQEAFKRGKLEASGHIDGHRLLGMPTSRHRLIRDWLRSVFLHFLKSFRYIEISQIMREFNAHRNHAVQYYSFLCEWNALMNASNNSFVYRNFRRARLIIRQPKQFFPLFYSYLRRMMAKKTSQFDRYNLFKDLESSFDLTWNLSKEFLNINQKLVWVVPPIDVGGGGATTISRFINHLSMLHVPLKIVIVSNNDFDLQRQKFLWYDYLKVPRNVGIEKFSESLNPNDFYVATAWQTWNAVIHSTRQINRILFLQDDERLFEPHGDVAVFIDNVMKYFDTCLSAGPWLANIAKQSGIRTVAWFGFGVDDFYRDRKTFRHDRVTFFYQPEKNRRLPMLTAAFIDLVLEEFSPLEVLTFGSKHSRFQNSRVRNLGVLSPQDLVPIYSSSKVGVCFSGTNASLVPQEMAACGLPVITNVGNNSEWLKTNGLINFVEPNLRNLKNSLETLISTSPVNPLSPDYVWSDWESEISNSLFQITDNTQNSLFKNWLSQFVRR